MKKVLKVILPPGERSLTNTQSIMVVCTSTDDAETFKNSVFSKLKNLRPPTAEELVSSDYFFTLSEESKTFPSGRLLDNIDKFPKVEDHPSIYLSHTQGGASLKQVVFIVSEELKINFSQKVTDKTTILVLKESILKKLLKNGIEKHNGKDIKVEDLILSRVATERCLDSKPVLDLWKRTSGADLLEKTNKKTLYLSLKNPPPTTPTNELSNITSASTSSIGSLPDLSCLVPPQPVNTEVLTDGVSQMDLEKLLGLSERKTTTTLKPIAESDTSSSTSPAFSSTNSPTRPVPRISTSFASTSTSSPLPSPRIPPPPTPPRPLSISGSPSEHILRRMGSAPETNGRSPPKMKRGSSMYSPDITTLLEEEIKQRQSISNGTGQPENPESTPSVVTKLSSDELLRRMNSLGGHAFLADAVPSPRATSKSDDSRSDLPLIVRQSVVQEFAYDTIQEGKRTKEGGMEGLTVKKGKRCPRCNYELESGPQTIKALGNFWHRKCFQCFKCREVITSKFIKKENLPFCGEKCVQHMTCDKCGTIVKKDMLCVGDLQLHPACFVCMKCGWKLQDEYSEYSGQPYCGPCMLRIEIV